jgi:predicted ATP-grasp superfamily ATP-dependent carboligase
MPEAGPSRPALPTALHPQGMSAKAHSLPARVLYSLHRTLQGISGGRAGLYAYLMCAQPLGATGLGQVRDDPKTVVQKVNAGHPLVAAFPRPPEVIRRRFDRGATCYVVTVKGSFAGFLWLAHGGYDEDEVRCRYQLPSQPRTVWDFDVYIEPRYRAWRTMARLWKAVDADLHAQGVAWTFSRIGLFNAASVQAHERLGAQHLCSGAFLVAGPLQLSLFSHPPYLHLGWRNGQRPLLRLNAPPQPSSPPGANPDPSPTTLQPHPPYAPIAAMSTHPPLHPTEPHRADPPAALVLGLDSHGLAVVRALADAGITVYALERDPRLPGVRSNRVAGIFWVEDYTAPNLIPALAQVRQALAQHRQVVLMPINDRQVGVIAQALPTVQAQYLVSWGHCAQSVVRLQRKDELEAVCIEKCIRYPRSVVFHTPQQAPLATGMRFPLIIKPVRPLSSFKTLMAQSQAELEGHLQARTGDLPILCQEYVAGDDLQIYFGALMLDHGRVLHRMAGRKIASHPPARGQTTIAETVEAPEVLRLTELFFDGLELTGPVSLELKRDPDGQYWVIEPTLGRTDFWAELCISAGFNQPLMEYQLAAGLPVTPAGPLRECVWYDTERDPAAFVSLSRQEGGLKPRGKAQVFPYKGHRDARPLWRALMNLVQRKIRPNPAPAEVPTGPVQPGSKRVDEVN